MHELSVCLSMVEQVESLAREHGAIRVQTIHVKVGPLSGVECELLERAFPLAIEGTVASGSRLVTERLPLRVRCASCAKETEVTMIDLSCRSCGDWKTHLVSGRELILARVEFDVEDPAHV